MYKYVMIVLVVAAGILGVATMIAQTPKSAEQVAQENKDKLIITAVNFQFDKAEYHVKKGSTLTVELVNKQGIHGLGIDAYGLALDNNTHSQKVTFDKAGTFDMHCIVLCGPGHNDMKAKLIVE